MRRNKFSLSHYRLMSCNMGGLYPISVMEVLPGDTIQHSTSLLIRCSPLLAPVMHPVRVRIHHWFVPNRMLWDNWEEFITGGPTGTNTSIYPTKTITSNTAGTLADHLGLPINIPTMVVSALPFRAYALIWNEHYRDQDLETPLNVSTADGNDSTTPFILQNCDWEKDYFTSARPWEQKGPAITIPLGTYADVVSDLQFVPAETGVPTFRQSTGSPTTLKTSAGAASSNVQNTSVLPGATQLFWEDPHLRADLTNASGVTIARLREAFALQRFEEARARYGSRYVEYLRYLGIRSSDGRMSRPEYLGGGKQTIQFSEVLQTAEGAETPVGEMAGHGIGAMRSNRYRRFFEEHGLVISLLSVQPKTIYMNGIHRDWSRRVKEDYWQRELQTIGQQEVLKGEIYGGAADPTATWGYQDRYDEYRRKESTVSGEFRTLLNHWHMARDFAAEPILNSSFVKCVPTERVFADNVEDTLYIMANHSIQARRMVLKTGALG